MGQATFKGLRNIDNRKKLIPTISRRCLLGVKIRMSAPGITKYFIVILIVAQTRLVKADI